MNSAFQETQHSNADVIVCRTKFQKSIFSRFHSKKTNIKIKHCVFWEHEIFVMYYLCKAHPHENTTLFDAKNEVFKRLRRCFYPVTQSSSLLSIFLLRNKPTNKHSTRKMKSESVVILCKFGVLVCESHLTRTNFAIGPIVFRLKTSNNKMYRIGRKSDCVMIHLPGTAREFHDPEIPAPQSPQNARWCPATNPAPPSAVHRSPKWLP